jgi:hypothetical protein
MEVKMLARREDEEWSLLPHAERDYSTEAERRFFEEVENPKPVTDELKAMCREFGRFVKKVD